ncbi:hypothetical protein ASZ90_010872 [hydrocarbon metagenome]|uniref:Uncharacterized protein n=1 Tax=hydrocarbon metagenome TaxID=938273 RepID=A0A0W8FGI3_9ZZZZ
MSPGTQAYGMNVDGDAHQPYLYKPRIKPRGGAAGATDENS